jgi:hypothetical protein
LPINDSSPVDLDAGHIYYRAGRRDGYTVGRQCASEDLAREWLLNLGHDFERQAISNGLRNHGPYWAEAMRLAAMGDAA